MKRMPNQKTMAKVGMLALLLPAALLLASSTPGFAGDPPEWKDPAKARIERAVQDLEREARTGRRADEPGVAMRHGDVRMVADLARVDMILEIENPGKTTIQWQRTLEIDPKAELIGATLERGTGEKIEARTLTLAGARRIYREVTAPRPTRRPTGGDPLRIERPGGTRLAIAVWPIVAGETVKVHLDFVTPLRGRGARRAYRDVIEADLGGSNTPPRAGAIATRPDHLPTPANRISMDTDWLVRAGDLVLAAAPTGMLHTDTLGGVMHFVASRDGPDRVPTIPLRTVPAPDPRGVVAVPGGGLTSRVAIWRFDPRSFVEAHRLRVPTDATLHLVGRRGSTYRLAPWRFTLDDEPRPVTARLSPRSHTLRYAVEVRDQAGTVLRTVEVEREVDRRRLAPALEGAITGWHRAMLVRRVQAWGRAGNERQRQKALDYAVDMGVLVENTAALALPRAELGRIPLRSRTEYRREGVPLGAQDGEADFEAPPYGSITR